MSREQNDLQAAIDALCEEIADGHLKASTFPADFLIEVKDKIARLTAERDEARAAIAAMQPDEDGERYRALRLWAACPHPTAANVFFNFGYDCYSCSTPEEFDAAIDAARKGEG